MHKEHYAGIKSWAKPEDEQESVELCPFTAAHYIPIIEEQKKEIERLRRELEGG